MREYDHVRTCCDRLNFIENGIINDTVRPEIAGLWKRSASAGVDPKAAKLPERIDKETIIKLINSYPPYERGRNLQWQQAGYKYMDEMDSVVYSTNPDNIILTRGGNRRLLDTLKERNIGIGADLKLEIAGANVVELSKLKKSQVWMTGSEHWTETFQDLVCTCEALVTEFGMVYLILLTTLDKFTPYHKTFFDYYIAMRILSRKYTQLNVSAMNEFIKLSMEQNRPATLLTDTEGVVSYANKKLCDLLSLEADKVIGMRLNFVLPWLGEAFNCLSTGHSFHMKEVTVGDENRHLMVDCEPIKKDSSVIGLTITLHDPNYLRNLMNRGGRTSTYSFTDLIGQCPNFVRNRDMAKSAAYSSSNLLIIGESGTGKELFAQAVHNAGDRSEQPFVPVNCSAIPRELIGSELFGYVGGSFTGARKEGASGKFELAAGGTLFLDEIAEMPLDMQSVLLRVLEERKVSRIGSTKQIPVDVRIIAATNKDLMQMAASGRFRHDLFYRLNVIRLELVPLRERKEDIPLLVDYFIKMFNISLGRNITEVSDEVMEQLLRHSWPGNVRELRNILERGINLASGQILTMKELPSEIRSAPQNALHISDSYNYTEGAIPTLANIYNAEEQRLIKFYMEKYNGNKAKVAKSLGMSRSTLYRKLPDK